MLPNEIKVIGVRRSIKMFLFVMLVGLLVPGQTWADYPLRDLVTCSPRGGLPNFFNKLQNAQPVTIAYMGGSITQMKGYRVLTTLWFEQQYPDVQFRAINAGVGGTGSDLGVFRLKRDVLDHEPDLLFVEFAVNDTRASPQRIIRAMEGIVRQTWSRLPACDIVFVYTLTHRHLDDLNQGKMTRSASVMEAVADHYNIPSIHMSQDIIALVKSGKMVMKSNRKAMANSAEQLNLEGDLPTNAQGVIPFAGDGVHPYLDTGHQLYLRAIVRSMPAIQAAGQVGSHALTKPLDPDNWQNAKLIPLTKDMFTGPVTLLDPRSDKLASKFTDNLPDLYQAQPGATLQFNFRGSKAMIYDVIGPSTNNVRLTLDGRPQTVERYDSYCSYHRLSKFAILDDDGHADQNQVHTVQITALADDIDKQALLRKDRRNAFSKNPDAFKPNNWYPGSLLIVGELVDADGK